jgi:hypothetical protein
MDLSYQPVHFHVVIGLDPDHLIRIRFIVPKAHIVVDLLDKGIRTKEFHDIKDIRKTILRVFYELIDDKLESPFSGVCFHDLIA